MTRPKKPKRVRLNLELSETVRKNMDKIRDDTDADSLSEVIRRALALYDFLVHRKAEGCEVVLRNKDTGEERGLVIL